MAGDDRLATAGGISTTHKVELASRGAVLVTEQAVSAGSSGQVDLQGGIDRDDVIVLGDDVRVVYIIHRVALDGRVVVQEVIHSLLPNGEGEDGLSRIEPLAPVGHHTRFDQVDHPGAERLRVDAEILPATELRADQVW